MMRNFLSGLVVALTLIAFLTWLLVHSMGPVGAGYVFAQRDVARVSLAEAALLRDVLQARAGLLRNYDPLVDDINVLQQSAVDLSQHAMIRDADHGLLDELLRITAQEETILEKFKTDNALLQNALSYFDMLDSRIAEDPRLTTAIAALGNAVLHLTRDPSQAMQLIVQQRLDVVSTLADKVDDPTIRSEVNMLVTHARMLSHLLPDVDRDLHNLFLVSTFDVRQDIRTSQDARRTIEEAAATRFQVTLFVAAVLLSVVLVRIGLQWRAGLARLRRRANLETVIADMSARLMTCASDQFDNTMDAVLERLGSAVDADRAYVILADKPGPVHLWQRSDLLIPTVGLDRLLELAVAHSRETDDLIDVSFVMKLPGGELRDYLIAFGNVSWCCIILRYGAGQPGVLAFDRTQRPAKWLDGDAGMLRMAGEALSNALRHRQATLQRLELEERLNRGRHLEALGTFASGIAHNFNNVIGALLGYAEMATDSLSPGTPSARYLIEIHRAGERAQELVGRILDFGTRSGIVRHDLAVDDLMVESVSMMRASLPDRIRLSLRLDASGSFISGDMVQLQQVVLNLIRNAAQATILDGEIIVRTVFQSNPVIRKLSRDTLPPGDYVCLVVADTGEGMDAATLASVFHPFFTTRPAGTGLGLATAQEIVRDHDGAIDVQSTLHQGTVFTIWLPAHTRQDDLASTARLGESGQTIMIIGQEQAVVVHDEEMLAALGYEPLGFYSVKAALAACQRTPNGFDILLVDSSVIRTFGVEAIVAINEVTPRSPIVILAWSLDELNITELAKLGVHEIIQRPLRSKKLAAVLATCRPGGE